MEQQIGDMKTQHRLTLFCLRALIINRVACNCVEVSDSFEYLASLNRSSFPDGFTFGIGSSAYQFEGATHVDGRKPSIWDTFVREQPDKIEDHSTGDIAEEFYFRYKKDIALLKEIGLDSFRFSKSWPRVSPGGIVSRGVSQQGVDFYNFLIDELLSYAAQVTTVTKTTSPSPSTEETSSDERKKREGGGDTVTVTTFSGGSCLDPEESNKKKKKEEDA